MNTLMTQYGRRIEVPPAKKTDLYPQTKDILLMIYTRQEPTHHNRILICNKRFFKI